jgi:hypothetical protein
MEAFDRAVRTPRDLPLSAIELGAQSAALRNPAFAMKVVKKYLDQPNGLEGYSACLILEMILKNPKGTIFKAEAVNLSRKIAITVKTDVYLAVLYHGKVLAAAGEKEELAKWISSAEAKLAKEPREKQARYQKLIDQLKPLL